MSHKTVISIVVALSILILTIQGYRTGFFEKPEYLLQDAQARLLRADKVADPKIKIILVDEASLKALDNVAGRWPWPRAIWGDLLDYLSFGGARAVLFDIIFIEQDKANKSNDKTLTIATKAAKNVYIYNNYALPTLVVTVMFLVGTTTTLVAVAFGLYLIGYHGTYLKSVWPYLED